MPATPPPLLTIDEYAALPDEADGWRSELVRGLIVREPPPSYEHGRVQMRIGHLLANHLEAHAPDLVCVGEFGVIVHEVPPTVRGPDLAVVRRDVEGALHRAGYMYGAPELVVEVVSPSNSAAAIQAKVGEYLAAGARVVWVVYPDTRTVAVHEHPSIARFLRDDEPLPGGDALPGLGLTVAEIFR